MYLAKILRNLTELGFIQWTRIDKGEDIYENGCFRTIVGDFVLEVATYKIKKGKILKNIHTYYTLAIFKEENHKTYEEGVGEGSGNIITLWLKAKSSSEQFILDPIEKCVATELVKQFGIKLIP